MNPLSNPAVRTLIQPVGWMLLHSLWQMAAIALTLALVLWCLRKSSANLRYLLACVSLFLMVLIPAITLNYLGTAAPASIAAPPLPENIIQPSSIPVPAPPILVQPAIEPTPALAPAAPAVEMSLKNRFIAAVDPFLPYLAVIWLMGVFSLSLWHLGGWCQLQRLRKRMVKPVSERIEQRLSRLSTELRIKKVPAIMESALVAVPTVIGWLKPVILLPASCLTGLTGEQLEALLAHELAHIKRYDYLINILQTLVEILGFYHPAVWWVSRRIRLERENCCDDLAVAVSAGSLSYARALTTLAEIHTRRPDLALTAAGGNLFHRIRRLAGIEPAPRPRPGWAPSIIALLFILALIIPATIAMTAKPKDKSDITTHQTELSKFSQTLPNGLTIELVGICTHPSAGKPWWQPDGHPLGYDIKTLDISGYKSDDPGYELVFRKTGDASFKIESVKGWDQSSGIQVLQPSGLAGFRIHIKSSYQKTNITIASPSGSWNTVVTSTGGGSYSGKVGNKTIVLAAAEQAGDDLIISSSDNLGYQLASRIIAVDSEGKVHEGVIGTDTGVNDIRQRTLRFKQLALSQLSKFEFQTCPYEYCTFKNVSLQPNFKTDVNVQTEIVGEKDGNPVDRLIVPGQRIGEFTFGMSKDAVLERLGKPRMIFYGEERYTLDNLPRAYFMVYNDISFHILNGSVTGLTALSPYYKLANGLAVGDSEQKIKQAFGDDFTLKETPAKDFLTYEDQGLVFEINKDSRTVMEINVSQIARSLSQNFKPDVQIKVEKPTGFSAEKKASPQWVVSDRPGAVAGRDYALQFNGVNDYVKIPANPKLDIGQSLTLSAWVKNDGDDNGQIIWRGDNQAGRDPYELHVADSRMEFHLDVGVGNISSMGIKAVSKEELDNNWHYWTGVYSSNVQTMYLYKDGRLESAAAVPAGFEYDTSGMWNMIGAVDFGNWQHFKGCIDDVQIWNKALTVPEIQRSMESRNFRRVSGLVAYWNFNEAGGSIAYDHTPNKNDGALGAWQGKTGYFPPSSTKLESPFMSAGMVGTWFFDNPNGDDEQMAVFPDGKVVVLYSNGHRDEVSYNDGFIVLPEYNNNKVNMTMNDEGNLLQTGQYDKGKTLQFQVTKIWRRISPNPQTELLQPLK